MVKFEKILSSVILKLRTGIPGIIVQSNNIEEGFSRPSFFVQLDNIKIEDLMKKVQERKMTIRIIYFPTDKNKNQLELLRMMDSLNESFVVDNILEIDDDTSTSIQSVDLDKTDDVLHFDFDIELTEMYTREIIAEMMEELNMKQEVD
jgi:hypothetical protein